MIIEAVVAGLNDNSPGGVDVDVDVYTNAGEHRGGGQVTLVRQEYDGSWGGFGSRAHWCDDALAALCERYERWGLSLDGIEAAARRAVFADGAIQEAADAAYAELF